MSIVRDAAGETLHIVTCLANPLDWESRPRLARAAIENWLEEPGVRVTLVECLYDGQLPHRAGIRSTLEDRFQHILVHAKTHVWNKESLLNIGIARLPPYAQAIGTFDADILFRRGGWAAAIVEALKEHAIVQPWRQALDLGPDGDVMFTHRSFASFVEAKCKPKLPFVCRFFDHDGSEHYGHTGYAWAWRRDFLDAVGGLIDVGAVGNGDKHMAYGLVGEAEVSYHAKICDNYRAAVDLWGRRALAYGGTLGCVPFAIEHQFHGSKAKRAYKERWQILIDHDFDPHIDLVRDSFGVSELAGNKPALAADIDGYFKNRDEDAKTL